MSTDVNSNPNPSEVLEKKQAVLTKFYGGGRKPYYHDFNINDGVCKNCHEFIGDATMRMCPVVTPDEVGMFRVPTQ